MASSDPQWEKEFDELCLAMGRALASWERVESACFRLFRKMLGNPPKELCSYVFYGVENFDARRVTMMRMALAYLGRPEQKAEWQAIDSNLKGASLDRNKVAHYGIQFDLISSAEQADGSIHFEFDAPRLQSSPDNQVNKLAGRTRESPEHNLSAADISRYTKNFLALASEIDAFSIKATPARKSPSTSLGLSIGPLEAPTAISPPILSKPPAADDPPSDK